ncbi:hypothetical protein FRC01_005515, partial [Tulasnella sp. 417]
MSSASPQLPEGRADASNAAAQRQSKSLEHQLECMDWDYPQSKIPLSEEPRTVKRSAVGSNDVWQITSSLMIHRSAKSPRRPKGEAFKITRIHFTSDGLQASTRGSHGEVVVATLTPVDGTPPESDYQVAIKKFLFSDNIDEEKSLRESPFHLAELGLCADSTTQTFANELLVLDGLDHPNIVRLIGFVEDMEKRTAWLVFPWEANGNVREFLRSGKWELPERVSLLNILVNSDHRAVITDFGSARIQTEARGFKVISSSPRRHTASSDWNLTGDDTRCPEVTVSLTNAQLTLTGPSWSFRWAAPEIMNEEEPCLASDIWALGWIAWE